MRRDRKRPGARSLLQTQHLVPFLLVVGALLGLGPGRLAAQTLQFPVTEMRIVGADRADARAGRGPNGTPRRETQGTTTAGERLVLSTDSASAPAPGGSPVSNRRQQGVVPAGTTRIQLSVADSVPAPPKRLIPPTAEPEIATTWHPAGENRPDGGAAPPGENGSVRLTFHTAVPGSRSPSAGRFPEDWRSERPQRPAGDSAAGTARDSSQDGWTAPGGTRSSAGPARSRVQRPAAGPDGAWAVNPLRAGGVWQSR